MSASDTDPVTSAAAAVMSALQPLAPDERQRVLDASAALFGLSAPRRTAATSGNASNSQELDDSEPPAKPASSNKRLSIVEFLNTKSPATNAQRLTCFAYYREHVEKKGQNFAKADLKPYFMAAKLVKPANYDRDFGEAISVSWIHEDGENSYLTQTGEAAVTAGFGGKGRPRGAAVSKKKTSGGKPS